MLILTRKTNECIIIGADIEIRLLDINGAQVKLGITAPKHLSVHREEIYQRIQAEKVLDK